MRAQISKVLIGAMLAGALASCASKPSLPDPSIGYPDPPAALMEPAQNLQTIPAGNTF